MKLANASKLDRKSGVRRGEHDKAFFFIQGHPSDSLRPLLWRWPLRNWAATRLYR